jgi:hypothetical protein
VEIGKTDAVGNTAVMSSVRIDALDEPLYHERNRTGQKRGRLMLPDLPDQVRPPDRGVLPQHDGFL